MGIEKLPEPRPAKSIQKSDSTRLVRVARFENLRVLAWSENLLYASRGYQLLRGAIGSASEAVRWQPIASFEPGWKHRISASNRLTSRLFREGFHNLVVLPSGTIVGAVPGAIVTVTPGSSDFQTTHKILRGTRPLHITAIPDGTIYWGEYFDNASREEVHIYGSNDAGQTWSPAYTFPKGAIRHVHNIVYDRWENCLWVLTGDYGDECRILRASCDFKHIEVVRQGNQQARAVAAVPAEGGLYFSSDTPLEPNFIYHLDRGEGLTQLSPISSSSIYACRAGNQIFFSTMVEPSPVNHDRNVRVFGQKLATPNSFESLLSWQKDSLPMRFLQYGNAIFPDGENSTPFLALTTVAVKSDDMVASIYSLDI